MHLGRNSLQYASKADWGEISAQLQTAYNEATVAAAWMWRRRDAVARRGVLLPELTLDTAAFILFLLAGVWALGSGVDAVLVAGGDSSGQWFSVAPVALGAAVVFGWRVLRDLRGTPPLTVIA